MASQNKRDEEGVETGAAEQSSGGNQEENSAAAAEEGVAEVKPSGSQAPPTPSMKNRPLPEIPLQRDEEHEGAEVRCYR